MDWAGRKGSICGVGRKEEIAGAVSQRPLPAQGSAWEELMGLWSLGSLRFPKGQEGDGKGVVEHLCFSYKDYEK